MKNTWKYKIAIADENVFKEISRNRRMHFPEALKSFIMENNAATPANYRFMVGSNERVFGAVLSFNRDESDVDSVFTALSVIKDPDLIPFGIDPFGNYICYSVKGNDVVFWDHETDSVESTGKTLSEFIDALY